jgi:Glycosyltransferase family 87
MRRFGQQYWIYFFPIVFLVYVLLSAYQIDFRAFYVAARSVMLDLDPYLNPVAQHPELYAAINADNAAASGFIYPPLAALLFLPFGLVAYPTAKILFGLVILVSLISLCYLLTQPDRSPDRSPDGNTSEIPGEAFLFITCSFPLMATFERGQVDIVVVLLTWLAFDAYYRRKNIPFSAFILGIATCLKIFPIVVLLYYLAKKQFKIFFASIVSIIILFSLPILCFKPVIYQHFFQFILPKFFGQLGNGLPVEIHGQRVVNNVVNAIEGNGLLASQDFANGFMNPLLQNNTIGCLITGLILFSILMQITRKKEIKYQFYAILTTINFFNPRAWIMGMVWYIPLFLHLYPTTKNTTQKGLLLLPLMMPPFTNLNGFLAYGIAIAFTFIQPKSQSSRS